MNGAVSQVTVSLLPINDIDNALINNSKEYQWFKIKKFHTKTTFTETTIKTEDSPELQLFYDDEKDFKAFLKDKFFPSLDNKAYLIHKEDAEGTLKSRRTSLKKALCTEFEITPNAVVNTISPAKLAEAKKLFEEYWKSKDNAVRQAKQNKILEIAPDSEYAEYCKLMAKFAKLITIKDRESKDAFPLQGESKEIMAKYPNFAYGYYLNGFIFSYQMPENESYNTETAIASFTKAIALMPNEAIFYYERGIAYKTFNVDKGQAISHKDALKDFDKAIALNPSYEEAKKIQKEIKYLVGISTEFPTQVATKQNNTKNNNNTSNNNTSNASKNNNNTNSDKSSKNETKKEEKTSNNSASTKKELIDIKIKNDQKDGSVTIYNQNRGGSYNIQRGITTTIKCYVGDKLFDYEGHKKGRLLFVVEENMDGKVQLFTKL